MLASVEPAFNRANHVLKRVVSQFEIRLEIKFELIAYFQLLKASGRDTGIFDDTQSLGMRHVGLDDFHQKAFRCRTKKPFLTLFANQTNNSDIVLLRLTGNTTCRNDSFAALEICLH